MSNWIKVEDHLPLYRCDVLVKTQHETLIGWYSPVSKWAASNADVMKQKSIDDAPIVSYWQPLPDDPEDL